MLTTMDYQKTMQALKRLRVETGSLACFGCGHEHNCSTQGCAILRNAVAHMEAALERATFTLPNEPLTQADLDSMDCDKVWIDYGDDGEWALVVNGRIYCLVVLGGDYTVYRRPPEGEA